MERLEATVEGRVQGVGYRDFACQLARRLGLRGYVQNLPDGTVRVVAEGERLQLDELLQGLREGPRWARVRGVDVRFIRPTGEFPDFRIRRGGDG